MSSPVTKTAASATNPFAIAAARAALLVVDVRRPRRVVRADTRRARAGAACRRPCADRLERRDRPVELHARLAYSTASSSAASHTPTSSAASITAASSATAAPDRLVGRRRGPTGIGAASPRARGAPPCGWGPSSAPALARGASRRNDPSPSWVRGDDDHPVGGVPVEHERLQAGEHPVGALAPSARADPVDRVAVAELLERDRAADARPTASCSSRSAAPSRRAASVANTADEKNGPGNGRRPISSITTTVSTSPSPSPPCSRGRAGRASRARRAGPRRRR